MNTKYDYQAITLSTCTYNWDERASVFRKIKHNRLLNYR